MEAFALLKAISWHWLIFGITIIAFFIYFHKGYTSNDTEVYHNELIRIKWISTLFPAFGLIGTLIGMYNAFSGASFDGVEIGVVMDGLMKSFALALGTTLIGVILKIVAEALMYTFYSNKKFPVEQINSETPVTDKEEVKDEKE